MRKPAKVLGTILVVLLALFVGLIVLTQQGRVGRRYVWPNALLDVQGDQEANNVVPRN
jgi:hypothetical protein